MPVQVDRPHATCTKSGGVCSIRLYGEEDGWVAPIGGEQGRLRTMCPWRFHQDGSIFRKIGEHILGDANPIKVNEVGFLKSEGTFETAPGKDVGRIDMVLVKSNDAPDAGMTWVAVEMQAVYFSGREMGVEFKHIVETGGEISMPKENRRPDYRSSGVKRLMPQLQIKTPVLRRWGKKMAVIVDAPFFHSMGTMKRERDVSNADIVWFLVDLVEDEAGGPFRLRVVEYVYTTLENATLGMSGGIPVSHNMFEEKIRRKINDAAPAVDSRPRIQHDGDTEGGGA